MPFSLISESEWVLKRLPSSRKSPTLSIFASRCLAARSWLSLRCLPLAACFFIFSAASRICVSWRTLASMRCSCAAAFSSSRCSKAARSPAKYVKVWFSKTITSVATASEKARSCDTKTTVGVFFLPVDCTPVRRKFSSQKTPFRSRWFVGSSSNTRSRSSKATAANSTRARQPPDSSPAGFSRMLFLKPTAFRALVARATASPSSRTSSSASTSQRREAITSTSPSGCSPSSPVDVSAASRASRSASKVKRCLLQAPLTRASKAESLASSGASSGGSCGT
mmetsp:Transcript_8768/g.26966  ORF Transcript_8768/g.26966 Transcript_8768/m.26966 type:complete len:281 (+) Transcript_8768:1076-1918(+)